MRTHVSLFTGIGGFDLACDWLGIKTVLQCEIDPYCLRVLEKHWPDVRRIKDVREVNRAAYEDAIRSRAGDRPESFGVQGRVAAEAGAEALRQAHGAAGSSRIDSAGEILADAESAGTGGDSQEQVGRASASLGDRSQGPFLLTGGFPCQPFSCAGKRKGREDDRYLWPEMLRVVAELKPRWVLGENVAGIVNMALDDCLAALEGIGYTAWAVVIPACAVNAPHRRDRVWIVAHANEGDGGRELSRRGRESMGVKLSSQDVADSQGRTERAGLCESGQGWERGRRLGDEGGPDAADAGHGSGEGARRSERRGPDPAWWQSEPNVGRVATGIPARVDRLKCLGNAIVPQVAYEIIKAMLEVSA